MATEPPYSGPETRTSRTTLRRLAKGMPQPILLIGGWAVYELVKEQWNRGTGGEYFGSRDIDLGFNTDPRLSLEELEDTNLPRTVEFLEQKGFYRQGMYRFVQYHDMESNQVIDEEESQRKPRYSYYEVAVDVIVSHKRDDFKSLIGFEPIVEPLLSHVFDGPDGRTEIDLDDTQAWVPTPHLMIGMKLASLPGRTKDDKALKDLCDLYALIMASGEPFHSLRASLHGYNPSVAEQVGWVLDSRWVTPAARHLAIPEDLLIKTLQRLL